MSGIACIQAVKTIHTIQFAKLIEDMSPEVGGGRGCEGDLGRSSEREQIADGPSLSGQRMKRDGMMGRYHREDW